jgi:5-methylcytosine-specific restriction endonuclease McrA
MRNIHNGRYYYDFQRVVGDMMKDNPKCFVCGSTRNVGPHHIRKVKRNNQQYADRDNLVLLCKSCHSRYHNKYANKRINQKTFALFLRDELHKRLYHLNVELATERNRVKRLEVELESFRE